MALSDYKLPDVANKSQDVSGLLRNPSNSPQLNNSRFEHLVNNIIRSRINALIDNINSDMSGINAEIDGIQSGKSDKIVGEIKPFAGATAPAGTLLCDGAAVSRTQYADLFAAIGTVWGAGNGSTTFNLPNLGGRTLIGKDDTYVLGTTGGEATHTLTKQEIPEHIHAVRLNWQEDANIGVGGAANYLAVDMGSGVTVGSDCGGQAHNNMQPYAAVSYVIVY